MTSTETKRLVHNLQLRLDKVASKKLVIGGSDILSIILYFAELGFRKSEKNLTNGIKRTSRYIAH